MLLLALVLALAAPPAFAQAPGCGFGLGLGALRQAEAALSLGRKAPSLTAGRADAAAAGSHLAEAETRFAGCGCRQLGASLAEARIALDVAGQATDFAQLAQRLERVGDTLGEAHRLLARNGCR